MVLKRMVSNGDRLTTRLTCAVALASLLAVLPAAVAGQDLGPSPDPLTRFTLADADGETATARERVGDRPSLLHLWATWCGPCQAELPVLARALEADPALAQAVLVISVDTAPPQRVRSFLQDRLAIELDTLTVAEGDVGSALAVLGYPATVWVEADGTIADHHTGTLDWTDPALHRRIEAFVARPAR